MSLVSVCLSLGIWALLLQHRYFNFMDIEADAVAGSRENDFLSYAIKIFSYANSAGLIISFSYVSQLSSKSLSILILQ